MTLHQLNSAAKGRIAARIGVELIVVSTGARVNAGEATLLARPYKTAGRKQKMYQI